MIIAIVEILFGTGNGQISSFFYRVIGPRHIHIFISGVNLNGFSPKLICALILWRSGLGLLLSTFHQSFTVISHNGVGLSFHVFIKKLTGTLGS